MPSPLGPEAAVHPASALLRRPKVDFDQNGQKSTMQELLCLGGFFPLARIQDRLPFSKYTLFAMAEAWKGEPSEWLVCAQAKGRRTIVMIHLDKFSEALYAQVEGELEASSLQPVAVRTGLEEGPEMEVLGEYLRGSQGLPTPA